MPSISSEVAGVDVVSGVGGELRALPIPRTNATNPAKISPKPIKSTAPIKNSICSSLIGCDPRSNHGQSVRFESWHRSAASGKFANIPVMARNLSHYKSRALTGSLVALFII